MDTFPWLFHKKTLFHLHFRFASLFLLIFTMLLFFCGKSGKLLLHFHPSSNPSSAISGPRTHCRVRSLGYIDTIFTLPGVTMVKTGSFIFKDPFPWLLHRKTLFRFVIFLFCFRIFTLFSFFLENPDSFHSIFILFRTLLIFRHECPMHPLSQPLSRGHQHRLHPAPRRHGKNRKNHIHRPISVDVPQESAVPFQFSFRNIPFWFPYFHSVFVCP